MKHRLGLLVALGSAGAVILATDPAGVQPACRSCHTEYRLPAN